MEKPKVLELADYISNNIEKIPKEYVLAVNELVNLLKTIPSKSINYYPASFMVDLRNEQFKLEKIFADIQSKEEEFDLDADPPEIIKDILSEIELLIDDK